MMMRQFSLAVLMLLALLGAAAAEEKPATCTCPALTLDQYMDSSTLIFTGLTLRQSPSTPDGGATFSRLLKIKGVELRSAIVANNRPGGDPACAATFMLNEGRAIFARGNFDTGYYTDKCLVDAANASAAFMHDVAMNYARRAIGQPGLAQGMTQGNLLSVRTSAEGHYRLGNWELAARFYSYASDISRGSPVDRMGFGEAALRIDKPREALTAFDDVLEKNPDNQQAWAGRNRALVQLGRGNELPREGANLADFPWQYDALVVDLPKANLSKAFWVNIKATGRNLAAASFAEAQLVMVDFSGADLSSVSFRGAKLTQVDFSNAKLEGADFDGAELRDIKWPQGYAPPLRLPLPESSKQ